MTQLIEKFLDAYEQGGIARRDFINSLAGISSASFLSMNPASPVAVFQGKSLNHVTLGVSDLDRSKTFYRHLLNAPLMANEENYCSLKLGNSFLALYKDDGPAHTDHFCIGIDSFNSEKVLAKLKKEMPESNPKIENGGEVYLSDPDNILLQLSAVDYKH